MSLVRAQLGEPQQSSLLTTLFSFYLNLLLNRARMFLVNWDCASAV
jgi:hypothetical protein